MIMSRTREATSSWRLRRTIGSLCMLYTVYEPPRLAGYWFAEEEPCGGSTRARRRAPAFLGPGAQLPPLAARRAAGPVPLRRLPRAPPTLPAARLPAPTRAASRRDRTVYVEAEWDPADPVGEMRYVDALRREYGLPTRHGRAGLAATATMRRASSRSRRRSRSCAASATSRAPTRAADGAPGGMTDATWRQGFARARAATACASTCRRRGGISREAARPRARFPRHADHPQPHRPAGRSQRRGHRRLEARDDDARRLPERRGEDLGPGPAGPAVDGRRPTAPIVLAAIELFGVGALHVREQLPGRQPVRQLRHDLRRLSRDRAGFHGGGTARAVSRQRRPHLRDGHERMSKPRLGYVGIGPDGPADDPAPARRIGLRGQPLCDLVPEQAASARAGRSARRPCAGASGCRRRRPRCCSTCRRPMRSARRSSATTGVASAIRPPQLVVDFSTVKVDARHALREAPARRRPAAAGSTRRCRAARRRLPRARSP